MRVYAKLQHGDQLLVSLHPISETDSPIILKRPSFCPIHHLSSADIARLTEDVRTRGIDTGAATLVESADGKVLLTRRAAHLRTFPGIWVPPGGHIEYGESLEEAGLRELEEETGLKITPDMCIQKKVHKLALWESVFPPLLSAGLPKRHHVVTYLYLKLDEPYTALHLQSQLNLDPNETDACAWLDKSIVEGIVSTAAEYRPPGMETFDTSTLPDTFKAVIVEGKVHHDISMKTSVLLSEATGERQDIERVSTGTKFALAEWLALKTANS